MDLKFYLNLDLLQLMLKQGKSIMLKANITFDEPLDNLLIPEEIKTIRAEIKVKEKEIIITAKDPVAMRAMFNGVMKSFIIIKKMDEIK